MQQVLAEFAAQHRALSRAREQLSGLTVTAQSRNGAVEITVGADGRVSAVHFTGHRFREMSARDLAESVLEARRTARTEAAARATAIVMSVEPRLAESLAPVPWSEAVADGVSGPRSVTARSRP
ncbi:YbaB/EbfC family nucleoid-associated protein [Streptomyces sp. NPDC057428]|uniref:YbaB/EbfC family nucleoid-associated protein n=1 Tax=Streptomyces sp. NPDC057428 TaxID=3346129 RepID=UPI003695C9CD